MLRQIRLAMENQKDKKLFETVVEIDETYIGGKPRKSNNKKDDNNKRGRGTKKTPVVGVLSREDKKVVAKVALPNKSGKKLTSKQKPQSILHGFVLIVLIFIIKNLFS